MAEQKFKKSFEKFKAATTKVDLAWQINTQVNRISFARTHNHYNDFIEGVKAFESILSPHLKRNHSHYYNKKGTLLSLFSSATNYILSVGGPQLLMSYRMEIYTLLYNLLLETLAIEGKTYIGDETEVIN